MEEDRELELINQRKLAQLKKRAEIPTPPKADKSDREVLSSVFYDRADEVLSLAYDAFPKQTDAVVRELARAVKEGRLKDKISGGDLYALFRSLGLRFNLNTTIKVEEKGKLVNLSEKLRMKRDD
jgi:DNA-binding TFAR19-related protein (PDSD5 family)